MPGSSPPMRASDMDRDQAVARLRIHYQAGRLTVEEFEERTRAAYASRTLPELDALMADLPEATAAPPPSPVAAASPLWSGVVRYAGCMLLLVAIWAAAGRGYFWPIWPIIGWGFGLLTRAAGMAGPGRACRTARIRGRRDRFHWA